MKRVEAGSLKSRFIETSMKRPVSCPTYRNSFSIPNPSGECLGKVIQDPRQTRSREDLYLFITARRNRELQLLSSPVTSIRLQLPRRRVWRVTVSRRLLVRRLFARRFAVCAPFTYVNKKSPFSMVQRDQRECSTDQWVTVLSTDESPFSLIMYS